MKLSQKGQIVQKPLDLFREPYILDFFKLPEPYHLSEADLETRLLDNLQSFLLELGKGFAFIGRKYRITSDELPIEYAIHGMSAQLFIQKYQLYLPNQTELRREIEKVYEQTRDESN